MNEEEKRAQTAKCSALLVDLINTNRDVNTVVWLGMFAALFAEGMKNCGASHEKYCQELEFNKKHFKSFWHDHENKRT